MNATDLHQLIVSSGLPEKKWPCAYDEHLNGADFWRFGSNAIAGGSADGLTTKAAVLLFTAVFVEELARHATDGICVEHHEEGIWSIDKPGMTFHRIGEGSALLEALCAAYREVKK